ncbi:hypothetical protein SNEBB_005622 [Seison nebaliae]|nr:hypothetical protein SNEBB_005622 [Seison nebaliae]
MIFLYVISFCHFTLVWSNFNERRESIYLSDSALNNEKDLGKNTYRVSQNRMPQSERLPEIPPEHLQNFLMETFGRLPSSMNLPYMENIPFNHQYNVCNKKCGKNEDPMCANNGITYSNLCTFRKARCRNKRLFIKRRGNCGDTTCKQNGKTYNNGQRFRRSKCNTQCTCESGTINCQMPKCPQLTCQYPIMLVGACCPACDTKFPCEHNGQQYEVGQQYKKDKCTICVCTANGAICSKKPCPLLACANPIIKPDSCCGTCPNEPPSIVCQYRNMSFEIGEKYQDSPCIICTCEVNGLMPCTHKTCPPVKCQSPIVKPGTCCPICQKICEHNGIIYETNQQFQKDDCTKCVCEELGYINCQHEVCPPLNCLGTVQVPGKCCPICHQKCEEKGLIIPLGKEFHRDACTKCKCEEGSNIVCTTEECTPITCSRKIQLPGTCCPICSKGCNENGIIYSIGQTFFRDPCTKCTCNTNSKVDCIVESCQTPSCTKPINIPSQCCPICPSTCEDGSKTYSVNQVFHRDACTKCICQMNNKVTCMTEQCPTLNCENQIKLPGACCGQCPETCTVDQITYTIGQVFYKDVCTRCFCGVNNKVECFSTKCKPVTCPNPIKLPAECCPVCRMDCTHEGISYRYGQVFYKGECNKCKCLTTSEVKCQKIICPPVTCATPKKIPGICCPQCFNTCQYEDIAYTIGQKFKKDPCTSCICNLNGQVTCIVSKCPSLECQKPVMIPGKCCPICPANCIYDGTAYNVGQSVQKDDCNSCVCQKAGQMKCETKVCPTVQCSNPIKITGKCCPHCSDTCLEKGTTYKVGDLFYRDTCVKCQCTKNGVHCQQIQCQQLQCMNKITHPGTCCPVCTNICVVDDKVYSAGEIFHKDECTKCVCENDGRVTCKKVECPECFCQNPIKKAGRCCPECPSTCPEKDVVYVLGQTFYRDPCSRCVCGRNGKVSCVQVSCPPVDCSNPQKIEGNCCPICPSNCEADGKRYLLGEYFNPTPCKKCRCNVKGVQCETIKCPTPPCLNPVKNDDLCCPFCPITCNKEGKVYRLGQTFDVDECTTCRCCEEGKVDCRTEQCPILSCSQPTKIDGICCPICQEKCTENGITYNYGQVFMRNVCEKCTCREGGQLKCVTPECPTLTCKIQNIVAGNCCPSCQHSCTENSVTYPNGTSFQRSNCEFCQCIEGSPTCRTIICPQLRCAQLEYLSNQCCPVCANDKPKYCTYEGFRYFIGQYFTLEKCKSCICLPTGLIKCKEPTCPTLNCPKPIKPQDKCCPICPLGICMKGDKALPLGFVYHQDVCTICECTENGIKCRKMNCPTLPSCMPIQIPGKCCPVCQTGCNYYGMHYEVNAILKKSPCEQCVCMQNNKMNCTSTTCPGISCFNPIIKPGECCPVCWTTTIGPTTGCTYNGQYYKMGEKYAANSCTICTCLASGNFNCKRKTCPYINCANARIIPGQCCPICPNECYEKGKIFTIGQKFYRDKCTVCTCAEQAKVFCETIKCPALTCDNPITIKGKCCPQCLATNVCTYEGRTYQLGQKFFKNPCETCMCSEGNKTNCIVKPCPPLNCEKIISIPGQCCKVCGEANVCRFEGDVYHIGQTLVKNKCTRCKCTVSGFKCDSIKCPAISCPKPVLQTGECCPTCSNNCEYQNKPYINGQTWAVSECLTCICLFGTVQCQPPVCPPTFCDNPIMKPGKCCLECVAGCEKNGKHYAVGEVVEKSNCQECKCEATSKIVCRTQFNCHSMWCFMPMNYGTQCCNRCQRDLMDDLCKNFKCSIDSQCVLDGRKATCKKIKTHYKKCDERRCPFGTICIEKNMCVGQPKRCYKTAVCNDLQCDLTKCQIANCPNPIPADFKNNKCCKTCKDDCSQIECPILRCDQVNQYYLPGECCPKCRQNCSKVKCEKPKCSNPILAQPEIGHCCSACERNNCKEIDLNNCPIVDCDDDDQYHQPGACCPSCPENFCQDVQCPKLENCEQILPTAIGECCPKCKTVRKTKLPQHNYMSAFEKFTQLWRSNIFR